MHSSASRAANGMSSAKRACEDPNRSFISEARNEPRASAASAGKVIMHRARSLHNNHGLVWCWTDPFVPLRGVRVQPGCVYAPEPAAVDAVFAPTSGDSN